MSVFSPIPLGSAIPPSPHAVSCSLPTMRSVRGYEEKDPAITQYLVTGYPRFVVHPFARQLAEHAAEKKGFVGKKVWLTTSDRMARNLADHLNQAVLSVPAEAATFDFEGVFGVAHDPTPDVTAKAKLFLQHIGGFVSSREAEDCLVRLGLKKGVHPELLQQNDPEEVIFRHLRKALPTAGAQDLFLATSGMNAVYAAFRACAEFQAKRGRTIWLQLGWLYLDTIAILKKFTTSPDDYVYLGDVFDLAALEKLFAEKGSKIAGLVTELPTNPLIQTPDVVRLSELCKKHGVKLILDPSVPSVFSVKVLPHSDILVASLTKYTASEGDVIAGLVVVNGACPDAAALRKRVATYLEPVYPRDMARLAAQIPQTEEVLSKIELSVPKIAQFLEAHPKVKEVFWAHHPASRVNYTRISRTARSVGGMISFSLKVPLDPFYDKLRLPKGPSFGMKTTLICPFMYLAHYDLVTTEAGRAELAKSGLDPDLLRLCIGIEPPEDIIEALAEALG